MPLVSLARLKPPSDKASSGERLLQNILLHWPRGPWRLSVSGISPWRFHEPLLMIILKKAWYTWLSIFAYYSLRYGWSHFSSVPGH